MTDLTASENPVLLDDAEKSTGEGRAAEKEEFLSMRDQSAVEVRNRLASSQIEPEQLRGAVEYLGAILGIQSNNVPAMENLREACRARLSDNHPGAYIKYDLNIPDLRRPVTGISVFEGWAFSQDGVKRIQVVVNGAYLCDADLGIPRPDVVRAYNAPVAAARSGFRFYINTVSIGNGVHELELRITTKTGVNERVQLFFVVANPALSEDERAIVNGYCAAGGAPVMDKSIFLPSYFSLETTIGCPSDCVMCPRERVKKTRRNALMPERYVDKILDEVDWPAMINWEWINDPLCDPRIYKFMTRAKALGFENWITTTGQILNEWHAHKLLEGCVDVIVFSVDTLNPRLYKAIRRGGDLEDVLRQIGRFMELKEQLAARTEVWITKIQLPQTQHEDHQAFADFFDKMGIHKIQRPSYRFRGGASDKDPALEHTVPNRMHCYYIENEMAITTDGNVILCACEAGAWDEPEANIGNMSIREAWLTPRRLQTIQRIRSKGLRSYDACREHESLDGP